MAITKKRFCTARYGGASGRSRDWIKSKNPAAVPHALGLLRARRERPRHTQANFFRRQTLTDERKFWWSELSRWDNQVEKGWVQWIELVAGLSAMIVLTLSLLAVWDGNPR
jgi:hypothetical protein